VVNVVERGQVGEKLPKGWKWSTVKDVCSQIDYGFTTSANFSIKEPKFLRITDIQNGCVNWESVPGCEISRDEEKANKLANEDIVFARTGGTTGKSFLIQNPPERAVFASYLIRLRLLNNVLAEYLYSFFQSDSYWQQVRASARGGAQPNVNATLLGDITFPLPPLSEQKRVVDILSDRLTAIDKALIATEAQLKAAKALPAAYFRQVFDSPEAQKWKRKKLGDVCDISTGTTPATNQSHYYEGATPFVRTSEIINNVITQTETNITQQAINDYSLKLYPSGTVLMAMYGQGKTRGQVAILEIPATTTQNAAAMVPCADLSSEYLWYWLRGQYEYLRKLGYQGDISHLSLKYVKQLEIPWVPIGNQKKIVLSLDDRMTAVNKLQRSLQYQLTTINQLPAATLRQAFNGEL